MILHSLMYDMKIYLKFLCGTKDTGENVSSISSSSLVPAWLENEHQAAVLLSSCPSVLPFSRDDNLGWRKTVACWVKTREKWKEEHDLLATEDQNKQAGHTIPPLL
ncbi:hypothetical protein ILYODFUR_014442 [Ilyodon furcidens]|uniref:Uncharacterized protein n=1 Tax=Ilyodon furcidens TaxID=33524 RepID=A0ABV0V5V2_9TELE